MKDLINRVYTNIQNLQLQPTKANVTLIGDSLEKLEELYQLAAAIEAEQTDGDGKKIEESEQNGV